MININWREKTLAATIHFAVTLAVALLAALLIFYIWFPGALAEMVGGRALFLLVAGCDLVLGPLISLVIYNSAKSRWHLVIDYTVIGAVQLTAFIYGVSVVADSRPVFIAFDVDRLEVVSALELEEEDLSAASAPQYRVRPWTGPQLVSIRRPTDTKERSDLLFMEITRKGAYLMPKYYSDYSSARETILAKSKPMDQRLNNSGVNEPVVRIAIEKTGKSESELRWLLVHHRFGFATALIDAKTALPLRYLAVDPD